MGKAKGLWPRAASSLAVAAVVLLTGAASAYASSDATVVRTTIASGTGVHSALASCPSGEDATGGGVALDAGSSATNDELISDSGPVDSTDDLDHTATGTVPVAWYGTSLINTSSSTAYVWAICAHTSTTVVRKSIGGKGTVGLHSGFARCPSGQHATGGGLALSGGSTPDRYEFISDDGPVNSTGSFDLTTTGTVPTQWFGTGYFVQSGIGGYVWAICSTLATTVVRTKISSGNQGGFHAGFARCPSGQRATGGGIGLSGGSNSGSYQAVSDTGPADASNLFHHTTTGTVPIQWYATADVTFAGFDDYAWAVCG